MKDQRIINVFMKRLWILTLFVALPMCLLAQQKTEYKWGDQMEAAQRVRLIRIIEKMEKNPAFSNKLGIKNTSEYLAEKEQKK